MKIVIFLCLLSLSACLSKPAVDQATPQTTAVSGTPVDPKTQKTEQTPQVKVTEPLTLKNATALPELQPQQNTSETNSTISTSLSSNTTINSKPENNKTTDKQAQEKEKADKGTTHNETDSKVNTENINNSTKEVVTTTTQKVPTKPMEVPKTPETPKSDADKPVLQARGFDGGSFIGGIILTLGLLAIGFMGFKYYKNQTERNYHTL
ncbi:unnamed protein product [Euphydryas editha]|uniref:Sialomucin core protein 24 n=1 Tax=Euphydryas editha TaxID=104508 RepID=A0AAU9TC81_EUPED|nr:unnamed protein product [Euphydryas editha]